MDFNITLNDSGHNVKRFTGPTLQRLPNYNFVIKNVHR